MSFANVPQASSEEFQITYITPPYMHIHCFPGITLNKWQEMELQKSLNFNHRINVFSLWNLMNSNQIHTKNCPLHFAHPLGIRHLSKTPKFF